MAVSGLDEPDVSVVIPCYNGEAFVTDAVSSVLAQTHRSIECIIVDDASTDGSGKAIVDLAAADNRVRPILLSKNVGVSGARNKGIESAKGKWIAFLDADDLYQKDRIERLLEIASATGADIVADRQSVRKFPDGPHAHFAFDFLAVEQPIQIDRDLFFRESSRIPCKLDVGYMKPIFRRSYLQQSGLRFDARYNVAEDFLLFSDCVCRDARFFGTSYAGYIYRRRPSSLSRHGSSAVILRSTAEVCDEIVRRYGATLSSRCRTFIERRKVVLERFAAFVELRSAFRERKWAQCYDIVVAQPTLPLLVGGMVARKVIARPVAPSAD